MGADEGFLSARRLQLLQLQERNQEPAKGGEGGADENQPRKAHPIVEPAARDLRELYSSVVDGHQEGEECCFGLLRAGPGCQIEKCKLDEHCDAAEEERQYDRRYLTSVAEIGECCNYPSGDGEVDQALKREGLREGKIEGGADDPGGV